MRGKAHLEVGILASLPLIVNADCNLYIKSGMLLAGMFGSLVPDIDLRESTISCGMPLLHLLHKVLTKPLKKSGVHRGITHSLLYIAVSFMAVYALVSLISKPAGLYVAGAYAVNLFVHDVLDMLSGGVAFLTPFITCRQTIANIKTGSFAEKLIVFLILCVSVGLALMPRI